MKRKIIIIICLSFLTSCIEQIHKRGYSFELSDYKLAQEGLSSKNTITQIMGSPTLISEIDNEELWIYFSEEVRTLLFFKPKIVNRKIMTISFDETDITKKIRNYNLDDKNKLEFNFDYTKVKSANKGFWSRIFSNIGQVSAN